MKDYEINWCRCIDFFHLFMTSSSLFSSVGFYYYPFSFPCSPPLPILPLTSTLLPSSCIICSSRVSSSVPCRLQIRNAWWLPHHSYIGERASFIQQFAHPWCITNKHWPRTCVVEQQWHGALLECLHTIDCEVEPLTISLDTKKAPRGAKLDCAQGRGPPDTESEGAMYCRYWYNARYVVSSALLPNPRVVSCSFPIGSTRKSKWTDQARYFKLDQDYLYIHG
jgi:hypothetical protein